MAIAHARRAKIFIFLTLFLDAMGIGLLVPVMPELIVALNGGGMGDAAIWGSILLTSYSAMQFLFSPLLGGLSDQYGRKPVLIGSLVVMAANYILMALANSIWLILLTRITGGITAATQSTAGAAMADISDAKSRAANFGLIGAGFGLGFVAGPGLGGLLAEFGIRAPFYAAAILTLLNLAFGLFALPETHPENKRRKLNLRRANPLGAVKSIAKLQGLAPLLWLMMLYEFALLVYPSVWAYFGRIQFDWNARMIGISLMVFGIAMAIVQGGLLRIALKYMSETRLVVLGLFVEIASLVGIAFAPSGLALPIIAASALGAVVGPTVASWMSRSVPEDAQGELQGVLGLLRSIAAIFAPLIMGRLFYHFTEGESFYLPGAPFLLSAMLMTICLAVLLKQDRPSAPV